MKLEIKYSNQAAKFLRKADKVLAKRVMQRIEELADEPLPKDSKKIQGSSSTLRVRVGDYRILYEADHDSETLGIIKIDKREKVYD
jgi:mRNA interferase RelE/StbE